MKFSTATRHPTIAGSILLVLLACFAGSSGADTSEKSDTGGDDGRGILRLDPFSRQLVPVTADQIKTGYIYSYYHPRLKRRVWSYAQPNKELWRAFGPGTTQLARRLDLRASEKAALARVAEELPELAEKLKRTGGPVYIRLNDDHQWKLAPYGDRESIFDLESGRRWEWYRDHYQPVTHTLGYRWAREAGRYVPVPRYHPSKLFGPGSGGPEQAPGMTIRPGCAGGHPHPGWSRPHRARRRALYQRP